MSNYFEWEGFEALYLEDSYVLGISEEEEIITFYVEAVLTEKHPLYKAPNEDEQYCYKRGRIVFENIKERNWVSRSQLEFVDSESDADLGNIDSLKLDNNRYNLSGDWGELELDCPQIKVLFD